MQITVNELMSLMKAVRARQGALSALRAQVSTKERYYSPAEKVVEPEYDVKAVDRQIVLLEKFLFFADSKIKVSNAKTFVDIEYDLDALLSPLQ